MGFDFATVLVFVVVAIGFALGAITASRLLGPKIPNPDKASVYECGERPIGVAWFNFNPRFYLVALAFVIFEVDIAFTFPVVTVYRRWAAESLSFAWVAFVELFIFTAILVVGLVWVWAHGDLEWVKTIAKRPSSAGGEAERRKAA